MKSTLKIEKILSKKLVKCEVENYGNNVKLVTELNVKRGWIFFFCDPAENYGDLDGVSTVRHSCLTVEDEFSSQSYPHPPTILEPVWQLIED